MALGLVDSRKLQVVQGAESEFGVAHVVLQEALRILDRYGIVLERRAQRGDFSRDEGCVSWYRVEDCVMRGCEGVNFVGEFRL